jgi:hypothetical protein
VVILRAAGSSVALGYADKKTNFVSYYQGYSENLLIRETFGEMKNS